MSHITYIQIQGCTNLGLRILSALQYVHLDLYRYMSQCSNHRGSKYKAWYDTISLPCSLMIDNTISLPCSLMIDNTISLPCDPIVTQ